VKHLLQNYTLPSYSKIVPSQVVEIIEQVLNESNNKIDEIIINANPPTWQNLVAELDEVSTKIERVFAPISHLNAVCNTQELRNAYEACLPKLSDFWNKLGQNYQLFTAYKKLELDQSLDQTQKTIIKRSLRDFYLTGIDLPKGKQAQFVDICRELSELSSKFANNVLDATDIWQLHITNKEELSGISALACEQLQQNAKNKGLEGYLLDLSFPNYYAVITYADNRKLREQIYYAYVTRASELSDNGKFDNSKIMKRILELRQNKANLLGFSNYAELSCANKMAQNSDEIRQFLLDLATKSRKSAQNELQELREFASKNGVNDLQSFDLAYFGEKLRAQKFAVNEEQIREYFPLDRVLNGMFEIANKLFNINFNEIYEFDKAHIDVRLFEIVENNKVIGHFFIDLYARQNKRSGAWMDGVTDRMQNLQQQLTLPAANLVANFTPPSGDKPALLTHDEVITLFHEFGHGLHHLLTKVNYVGASGINGVAWDAVEFPSQFFENWCWQQQGLELIAGHYQTGEQLPIEILNNLLGSKNFGAALAMLRQIEFALFDLEIHAKNELDININEVLDDIRRQVAVVVPPKFNRFAHSFSHIFAGGYAAGYYSYKWAEVLASDAFTRFKEEGILNSKTGEDFKNAILAQGGSREPLELFEQFMGRKPQIKALLEDSGLL